MEKTIIAEGRTTNEAIEKGLKQLNVSKNKVHIKVLENEDKRSFFSILAPRVVKVELTLKEEERAKDELTKILGYIDMLNELDTTDVEAMSHPFPYTNNFREDECKASTDRELILKNAPQQKDGCFKVPTTVE